MDWLGFNSGDSGILESTWEYSGMARGSYGNKSGMTREYLRDSDRVRDMTVTHFLGPNPYGSFLISCLQCVIAIMHLTWMILSFPGNYAYSVIAPFFSFLSGSCTHPATAPLFHTQKHMYTFPLYATFPFLAVTLTQ